MRLWVRLGLGAVALIVVVFASRFDGDVLREYLPEEVSSSASVFNERNLARCAISIYEIDNDFDLGNLPFSKSELASTDWLRLPVKGKLDEGSYAVQALYDGDDCFDSDAQRILKLRKLSEYYTSERMGFFLELRPYLILIHDIENDVIVISARS